MVKFNSKRFLAFVVASMMVVGSSVTAFAAAGEPVTDNGTGTYEGDDVTFAAIASFTVPAKPQTGFNYIADPNGLIAEAAANGKATYQNYTFDRTNTHGVYFPTSAADGKTTYTEKSAAVTITNNNASPLNVSVKIKQADGDSQANVPFTDDATFGGATPSTAKSVYIAVTNGTDTAAIKAGGAEVALSYALSGKISNYELTYNTTDSKYEYALKDGIQTTDATKWNSTSFYVTGALNENAKYEKDGSTEVKFPAITVTYDADPGAAPVKIKSGIEAKSGELTVKKAATVEEISLGATKLAATTHYTATAATTSKGSVVTFTPAATALAYNAVKASPDGVALTVKYNTGDTEVLVLFAK